MIAFASAVAVLCTTMNIGCNRLADQQPINVVTLLPYQQNINAAFSGQYSSGTTHFQKKLKNTKNFGPNGIAQMGGFTFDELDLSQYDQTPEGARAVAQKLQETDILYWSIVSPDDYSNFQQQLVPFVQNKSVVLLMTIQYPYQNRYSQAFGYTANKTSARSLHTTDTFTGPFGHPQSVQTYGVVSKFTAYPPYATPILQDDQGEQRGLQEDTKIILGDIDHFLNTVLTSDSDDCTIDDNSIFACNVFSSLVEKVKVHKQKA